MKVFDNYDKDEFCKIEYLKALNIRPTRTALQTYFPRYKNITLNQELRLQKQFKPSFLIFNK